MPAIPARNIAGWHTSGAEKLKLKCETFERLVFSGSFSREVHWSPQASLQGHSNKPEQDKEKCEQLNNLSTVYNTRQMHCQSTVCLYVFLCSSMFQCSNNQIQYHFYLCFRVVSSLVLLPFCRLLFLWFQWCTLHHCVGIKHTFCGLQE